MAEPKKRFRHFLFSSLMLLSLTFGLPNIVYAQMYDEYTVEDYQNPDVYENPAFYQTSDPSQWSYDLVDWYKVDFNRKELYLQQAFFDNLPDNQWSAVSYKLIDDYTLIQDHRKIDGDKYVRDLGCRECDLTFREPEKGLITYSKQGIRHATGDHVSSPGTYPLATSFYVTDRGINVKVERTEGFPSFIFPAGDAFYYNSDLRSDRITYGTAQFTVRNGYDWLRFIDGKIFIPKEDYQQGTRIDEIYILTDADSSAIQLFFDGNTHPECGCAYVSMSPDKRRLVSAGSGDRKGYTLTLRDPWLTTQATLSIKQRFGTTTFQNRKEQGLIPSITMELDPVDAEKEGQVFFSNEIVNGKVKIRVYTDGSVRQVIDTRIEEPNSNPLVLNVQNTKGESLIGTAANPLRLIFDDQNRIATIGYSETVTGEQARVYSTIAGDVAPIAGRALEASKRREELKQNIQQKYGVAPMHMMGWVDDKREVGIVRSLLFASRASGLSPEFVTAAAFQEGLNVFIEKEYYQNPNVKLYSDAVLGLMHFPEEADNLKRKGFLRRDFQGEKGYLSEYSSKYYYTQYFSNVQEALEAFTATLAERKADFLTYARNKGYDVGRLSEDQINYWTYTSFNCGKSCMRERAKESLDIPVGAGTIQMTHVGNIDPHWNAKRVLATTDLIKQARLYERAISEEIVQIAER